MQLPKSLFLTKLVYPGPYSIELILEKFNISNKVSNLAYIDENTLLPNYPLN